MSRRPRRKSDHSSEAFRPVRIGRNVFPVIGRVRIRNRTYLLLKRLSPAPRERFLAFDPHAGPRGALRAVHCVPRTPAAVQHVKVLGRLPHGWPLPFLLDYEDDGESVRLALDWVEGIDLRSYLDRIRCGRTVAPSPSIAVRLVRELAHGLRTLNLCVQVVHGDLKPANLILTRKTSHLVMIDFGSAWMMEQTSTRVLGDGMSAAYAATELQLGDGMVDDRADQFSASVILYELLTLSLPYANLGGRAGRPEYGGDKTLCLIPPSALLRDPGALPIRIRNELDTVVSRGLSLHADDRYPTNGEWLVALDGLFRRMSDVAAPPSRTTIVQRAIQWFDRQRRGRSPRQDKGV